MSVRLATPADVPIVSKFAVLAHASNPSNQFQKPRMREHMDYLYRQRLLNIGQRVAFGSFAVLEVVEHVDGVPKTRIVGCTGWQMPDETLREAPGTASTVQGSM